MPTWLVAFASDDSGQDLVEYAVLTSFVALITIGAAYVLGVRLDNWYNAIAGRAEETQAP